MGVSSFITHKHDNPTVNRVGYGAAALAAVAQIYVVAPQTGPDGIDPGVAGIGTIFVSAVVRDIVFWGNDRFVRPIAQRLGFQDAARQINNLPQGFNQPPGPIEVDSAVWTGRPSNTPPISTPNRVTPTIIKQSQPIIVSSSGWTGHHLKHS